MRQFRLLLVLLVCSPAIHSAFASSFKVTSPDIRKGGTIAERHVFNSFGCKGMNLSPALKWHGVPKGTKSFAVTVYDPDAPTGSGWWHWVVFNIPAETRVLPRNAGGNSGELLPGGSIQSRTDFGKPGYGGPCPPAGDKPHRYRFTVHALKTDKLPLDADAPAAMVGFYLGQNTIARAVLKARYGR